jgi:hypothetical protein
MNYLKHTITTQASTHILIIIIIIIGIKIQIQWTLTPSTLTIYPSPIIKETVDYVKDYASIAVRQTT